MQLLPQIKYALLFSSSGLLLFIFYFSELPSNWICTPPALQNPQQQPAVEPVIEDEWAVENYVSGPPGNSLRDSLSETEKYITTFVVGGWTNNVMTYTNLIYLALLSSRIPVIPPFHPSFHMTEEHDASEIQTIPFSKVFDLPLLRKKLQHPVLEWADIKKESSQEMDELGCWSAWINAEPQEKQPRGSYYPSLLHLNITYTAVPETALLEIPFMTFQSLAALSSPSGRQDALNAWGPVTPEPDEHFQCFDHLYWLSTSKPYEFEYDWSPAWNIVGTKMRWSKELEGIAFSHLKRLFGVEQHEPLPPYIAVHVRHTDFAQQCGFIGLPLDECFAPVATFARRVKEMQHKLAARGIEIPDNRVVVTSDETRQEWWDEVHTHGWVNIDYEKERTIEEYGHWYPLLIDAVVQSSGHGFVGTKRSTMSLLAQRRTHDWRKGETWLVAWGMENDG